MWGRPRRIVRTVTRQVEPEWDADDRALAEGLDRHGAECCPGCGLHKSILADPERHAFTLEDRLCAVCAGQQVYGRRLAASDEEWDKRHEGAKPEEPRPSDGRHTYLRPLTPEEIEAARARSGSGRPRRPAGPMRSR